MSWPIVARRYVETLRAGARRARTSAAARVSRARTLAKRRPELPEINLSHVRLMTDDTGMLQHATFDIPRYSDGYCIDDNARALLLMTHVEEAGTEAPHVVRALATRYLAFVNHAFDETTRPLPELPHLRAHLARRAGLGRQPRSRALGARRRRRALLRPGTAGPRRAPLPRARCPRSRRSRARARGPTRCSASTSTSARSRATAASRRCGRSSRPS